MKYEEALEIGTEAQGYVKCTFAEFFKKNGHKLFSLQRGSFSNKKKLHAGESMMVQTAPHTCRLVTAPMKGTEQHGWTPDDGVDDNFYIEFDLPLVRTTTGDKGNLKPYDGKVPVRLMNDAKSYILNKVLKTDKYFYMYAEWVQYKNGYWDQDYEIRHERAEDGTTGTSWCLYRSSIYPSNSDVNDWAAITDWWTLYAAAPTRPVWSECTFEQFCNGMTGLGYPYIPKWAKENEIFKYSLWNVGMWVILRAGGLVFPTSYGTIQAPSSYEPAVQTFFNKWKENQYDALQWLVRECNPTATFIRDHKDEIPYININIKLSGIIEKTELRPTSLELKQILEEKQNFYVKPAAFVWEPLNHDNVAVDVTDENGATIVDENGEPLQYTLEDYVEICRKQMENAKNVLLAAGVSNLI